MTKLVIVAAISLTLLVAFPGGVVLPNLLPYSRQIMAPIEKVPAA
ncbi:hypothetical protein [Bradyrhizobium diazoefficiens]|nr:hypothetical protein [Bradyrhizobium diazoefficiens]